MTVQKENGSSDTTAKPWKWWQIYSWKRHDFGPYHEAATSWNGLVVSVRRFKLCKRCGATSAMGGGCR